MQTTAFYSFRAAIPWDRYGSHSFWPDRSMEGQRGVSLGRSPYSEQYDIAKRPNSQTPDTWRSPHLPVPPGLHQLVRDRLDKVGDRRAVAGLDECLDRHAGHQFEAVK